MARNTSLGDANHDGRIDSVELSSKALLLDVQAKSGGRKFQVNTPQAIAAVRGTRWAVDVAEGKTSVFVVHGRVRVGRRSPGDRQVVLGPGEGVDVEALDSPGREALGTCSRQRADGEARTVKRQMRRRLKNLVAVILAGLWGAFIWSAHAQGHLAFLDRVEAAVTDFRTILRGVKPPPD